MWRACLVFLLGVTYNSVSCSTEAPRFCQVCDGSSGFRGTEVAVYHDESQIRCNLRCHTRQDCEMTSYSEHSKVCKLLKDVIQDCSLSTTDIQYMNEDDIIQVVPTVSSNDSLTNESASSSSTTTSKPSATVTSINVKSSTNPRGKRPMTSTTTMPTYSTRSSTTKSASMGTTTATTTGNYNVTSGHPWVTALYFNSSQNGTQMDEIHLLMNNIASTADINVLIVTGTGKTLLPIDWFKAKLYQSDVCVKNFGFYVYSAYKPRKSIRSICASSDSLREYAWPSSASEPITISNTPFVSVSFFTRDYSGHYLYGTGQALISTDLTDIKNLILGGFDMKYLIESEEWYSVDVVYFNNANFQIYALSKNYATVQPLSGILDFVHILHTLDGDTATLKQTKSGDITLTNTPESVFYEEIRLFEKWNKVYEVSAAGHVLFGSYDDLQKAVSSGHRVRIATTELIAIADTVAIADDKIIAIVLEEFKQENGAFKTIDSFPSYFAKLWRVLDSTGRQTIVEFFHDGPFNSESLDLVGMTWFVDTDNWWGYHTSLPGGGDTSLLQRAIEYGSRLRLKYEYIPDPAQPVIILDANSVTIAKTVVEAETTETLYLNYSLSNLYTSDSEYMHLKFSTDGTTVRYLTNLAKTSSSASSFTNAYEVTWYVDSVN